MKQFILVLSGLMGSVGFFSNQLFNKEEVKSHPVQETVIVSHQKSIKHIIPRTAIVRKVNKSPLDSTMYYVSDYFGIDENGGADSTTRTTEVTYYEVFNRKMDAVWENDKSILRIHEGSGGGLAWLKGLEFSEGVIEFDARGRDVFQKSFLGIAFHGADNETYESVYFRPFNFQSADPDRKVHAVQYERTSV